MNKSKCKDCGQLIIWCRTETGKRIAVDPQPSSEGNLQLASGELLPTVRSMSRGYTPGTPLYLNHAKSCRKTTPPKKPLTPPGPVLFEEPRS